MVTKIGLFNYFSVNNVLNNGFRYLKFFWRYFLTLRKNIFVTEKYRID